jgi:hypothetical protein
MKIVNVEDGKKKVYVQLNDIMMMMQFGSPIPAEVMEKHFMNMFIVTDENRFEFSEFTDPHTVEFFEQCEWIPDFREFKDLTEEEIIAKGHEIGQLMNQVAMQWNGMTPEQREANEDVYNRHESLKFKMHSTAEILWTKQGHRVMPFPTVPDYEGFKVNNDDCEYMAQQGINPLQVLIFRKDGKVLDEKKEVIPQGLVEAAEMILVNSNLEHNEFFGDFERSRKLSVDGKYVVTTFRIITPEEKDKRNGVIKSNSPEEKMTLGKRIKNWFNGKRSN